MTSVMKDGGAELAAQLAAVQEQASKLIVKLYERGAYASEDEFHDIMSLAKALRAFCGHNNSPAPS